MTSSVFNATLGKEPIMATEKQNPKTADPNRDPLSGEEGAHPVGVGVGAAVGGGAAGAAIGAAGAAIGAAGGPIGAVVGAVAGSIVGGVVGKGVAESINPTVEDAFWRENYRTRPYIAEGTAYEEYQPAYRYGWESRARFPDR